MSVFEIMRLLCFNKRHWPAHSRDVDISDTISISVLCFLQMSNAARTILVVSFQADKGA